MSARERRAKARKRSNTAVRRIGGSTAVAATAAIGLAGPILSVAEAAVSGSVTQLANINTVAQGSNPADLTNVSGTLYYSADSLADGQELWKSTGSNGTQVADLVNGAQGSYPTDLTNANGHLFFFAQNTEDQYQLWTSNGSANGTTELTDLPDLLPYGLVNVGNNVSFLVDSGANTQLWTSNGTTGGTTHTVLTNLEGGTDLTVAGTELYFAASGNTPNTEGEQFLWASNGAAAGTAEVTPGGLDPTGTGAYYAIDGVEAVGTNVYFAASTSDTSGDQVYGANHTVLATSDYAVSNFGAGTSVTNLASNGADVFFETQNSTGAGLWDGTIGPAGLDPGDTKLLNLQTTNGNGLVNPYLTNVGGDMYFAAENATANDTQLWESTGAANGTNVVSNSVANVTDLVNGNGTLYFAPSDGNGGLWSSNGTSNGTTEVANSANLSDVSYLANLGSTLYFSAASPTAGSHLWGTTSNGSAVNGVTEIDANVDAADSAGSYPTDFTATGANVFFAATSANGPGLWVSNGTNGATGLANGLVASSLVNVNGTLAFLGEGNGANATEQIWISNGTAAGTQALNLDIGADPTDLTNVGGELYFEANGLANGTTNQVQLWETNGANAGTTQLTDFSNQFVMPEAGEAITNAGSEAYFVVNADGPAELYQSNGTAAGTFETNGTAAPSESSIYDLTAVGGELYYVTSSATGEGLWVTNGTAAGTTELVSGATPSELTNVNGTLFFTEQSSAGFALWSTGGTVASTRVVKTGVQPYSSVADGGELYFTTFASATNSTSLWESNGTSAGTTVFANVAGYTGALTNDDGALVFAANDGTHGLELWTSNGTSSGTGMVSDIWPGPHSSLYATSGGGSGYQVPDFTNAGSTLFFAADDGTDGVEPWVATGLSPVVPPATTPTTTTSPTTTTTSTPVKTTPPVSTTTTTPKPTPTFSVTRLSKLVTSGDSLTLTLSCSAGVGSCVTTAKVEIVETIKNKKIVAVTAVVDPDKVTKSTKKTVILVSRRATVKPGRSGILKLTLDGTGKRLLTAHKKLNVELLVTQGSRRVSGRTVKLTAPKVKKTTR